MIFRGIVRGHLFSYFSEYGAVAWAGTMFNAEFRIR